MTTKADSIRSDLTVVSFQGSSSTTTNSSSSIRSDSDLTTLPTSNIIRRRRPNRNTNRLVSTYATVQYRSFYTYVS